MIDPHRLVAEGRRDPIHLGGGDPGPGLVVLDDPNRRVEAVIQGWMPHVGTSALRPFGTARSAPPAGDPMPRLAPVTSAVAPSIFMSILRAVSAMVGALLISRAVDDEALSDEILRAVRAAVEGEGG
ncbi:MAG: hypothetical protein JST53_13140 [Actinobacteria bacterium]|nr:hypothetical protein [Actinomycetota bacterium]